MAGITVTGFQKKQLPELVTGMQARTVAALQPLQPAGDPVDVSAASVLGQVIGVVSQDLSDLWELAEDTYNNIYPATAEGVCLEQSAQTVGVFKLGAAPSTIPASVSGDEGAVVDTAFQARNTSGVFQADIAVTITAGNADRVRVQVQGASVDDVFTLTINGTPVSITAAAPTAASVAALLVAAILAGPPAATAQLSPDVGAGDTFDVYAVGAPIAVAVSTGSMGIADRAAQVPMTATTPGAIVVDANTVTSIVTPRGGITAITNRVDGVQGVTVEPDKALRARRRGAVRGVGSGSASAVTARLPGLVPGVFQITVYENRTDAVDGAGRPPGSYEVVVLGGEDSKIAAAIWALGPMGNKTFGNTSAITTDAAGNPQTINFSRPSIVYLWAQVVLTSFDPTVAYPSDGDQQVKNGIATQGNLVKAGGLVIPDALKKAVYTVPGISGCTVMIATSATAAGPPGAYSSNNLQLTIEQKPQFDPSRISVTP